MKIKPTIAPITKTTAATINTILIISAFFFSSFSSLSLCINFTSSNCDKYIGFDPSISVVLNENCLSSSYPSKSISQSKSAPLLFPILNLQFAVLFFISLNCNLVSIVCFGKSLLIFPFN